SVDGSIYLPSGSLEVTSTNGDLTVRGVLDVSGQAVSFYDVTRYTNAGSIKLSAVDGNVVLGSDSSLSVAAAAGGGDGGTLAIHTPQGLLVANGNLSGKGGNLGANGSFLLDTLTLPTLGNLSADLSAAGLT